jgi:nanoRNase/pAp phosphatase (c-di-AMP/oligoRNAs hydrolase)
VREEKLDNSGPHENAAGYAQELLEFLAANRQSLSPLLILPHDYPDPDALAAAFALHFLAKECYGIESRIAPKGGTCKPFVN